MGDEKLEEFDKLEADIWTARSRSEGLKRYSLSYLIWQVENIKSESFKKEIENLNEEVESTLKKYRISLDLIEKFALENKAMREALNFYADKKSWHVSRISHMVNIGGAQKDDLDTCTSANGKVLYYGGKRARACLENIDKKWSDK